MLHRGIQFFCILLCEIKFEQNAVGIWRTLDFAFCYGLVTLRTTPLRFEKICNGDERFGEQKGRGRGGILGQYFRENVGGICCMTCWECIFSGSIGTNKRMFVCVCLWCEGSKNRIHSVLHGNTAIRRLVQIYFKIYLTVETTCTLLSLLREIGAFF